jgi:hypothetical protein
MTSFSSQGRTTQLVPKVEDHALPAERPPAAVSREPPAEDRDTLDLLELRFQQQQAQVALQELCAQGLVPAELLG